MSHQERGPNLCPDCLGYSSKSFCFYLLSCILWVKELWPDAAFTELHHIAGTGATHLWDQQLWFVKARVIECIFWNSYYISQIFISKAAHWRSIPWWWFTSWRDGTRLFDRLWSQHAFVGETDDFKWCLRSGCLWAVWLAGVLWMVSFQVPLCHKSLALGCTAS